MADKITIIEGPAGAGKSALVGRLVTEKVFHVITEKRHLIVTKEEQLRDFGDHWNGEVFAILRDLNKIMAASLFLGDCVIDRCFISSYVYNFLRRRKSYSTISIDQEIKELLGIVVSCYGAGGLAVYSLENRGATIYPKTTEFVFLIPSMIEIMERRQETGKEYPFLVDEEYECYHFAYEQLRRQEHVVGRVRLLTTESDINGYITSVQ